MLPSRKFSLAIKSMLSVVAAVALAASDCGSAEKRVWCRTCEYDMAIYQPSPDTAQPIQVAGGKTFQHQEKLSSFRRGL